MGADRRNDELRDIAGRPLGTLTVPRRFKRADVDYVCEVSGDLVTWSSGAGSTVVLEDQPSRLVVRDNLPMNSESKRFIRLSVRQR